MKINPIKNLLTACVVGLLLSPVAYAKNNPPPTIKADAPNRYVVKKGDTLWGISGRYLKNPVRWREIWATNKQLKNPHLIYPNDVLILCVIKGKTLVGVDTGEGCAGIEKAMQEPTKQTRINLNSSENSIPAIPLAGIRHWLERVEIVDPLDFETTPYVLAAKEGRLISATGDKIYVKGAPLILGQTYGVYRKGEPYIDVKTGQIVGLETIQVASGIVTDVAANGVSSIRINQIYDLQVKEGDRVFSEIDANLPPAFYPAPAEVVRGGSIVRVLGDASQAGKDSVVSINLGAVQGARAGHVLDVYRKGKLVQDPHNQNMPVRLPSEKVGSLMVFKVFNQISYAYVLEAELPLGRGDQLLPPPD